MQTENNMSDSFYVVVRCMTYNHHAYIEDAMNGFCMQKTTFPFVCVIVDDASIDGAQNVIKKYVQEHFELIDTNETDDYVLNFAQHKRNTNCHFAVVYLKYNHYSINKDRVQYCARWQAKAKYLAFCEGDDYWIDVNKLQMQVSFLENNNEYGMCYTNFNLLDQKTHRVSYNHFFSETLRFNPLCTDLGEWIISSGYKAPMTWVYKASVLDNYEPLNSCDGTFVMVAHFLANTKIKCLIDNTTAVYRKLNESASHSSNLERLYKRSINIFEVQNILINKYGLSDDIKWKCSFKFYSRMWKLFIAMNDEKRINEALKVEKSSIKRILLVLGKNFYFSKFFSFAFSFLRRIKLSSYFQKPIL